MGSKRPEKLMKSLLLGAVVGVSAALFFSIGFFFRDIIASTRTPRLVFAADENEYPLLAEVQTLLNEHYLRQQPPFPERQYAAIRGMLSSLGDRYTFFIPPAVAKNESDALAGTYGGIGVQVTRNEQGELVLYPFQDSPAQEAGIKPGDILLAVNGAAVHTGMSQDEIDRLLRGEVREGNGVEVTISTPSTPSEFDERRHTRTLFIEFGVINIPSVVWRTLAEDSAIGYVQILSFTSRTPAELKNALTDLRSKQVIGLVLDLRNNSGGLLQESIAVADEFLDSEVIVYERNNKRERTFTGEPGGLAIDLPLVILVNGGTASASELVAGALRDNGRGLIVGQRSFGKGTVQQIFTLSDQSAVHITSAEWFTPARHQLEENGLEPDIAMIPDASGRDVELGEAVRQMRQIIAAQVP